LYVCDWVLEVSNAGAAADVSNAELAVELQPDADAPVFQPDELEGAAADVFQPELTLELPEFQPELPLELPEFQPEEPEEPEEPEFQPSPPFKSFLVLFIFLGGILLDKVEILFDLRHVGFYPKINRRIIIFTRLFI